MNIYNYNWWEVLIFIIVLELGAFLMAFVLLNLWSSESYKRVVRKKRRPSSTGYKSGLI